MVGRLSSAGMLLALVGALFAGGCGNVKEMEAMNNRLRSQLDECTRSQEQLAADLAAAHADVDALQRQLSASEAMVASLRQSNQSLQSELTGLQGRLAAMGDVPAAPAFGPTIALPQPLHERLLALQQQYPGLFSYDAQRGMLKFESDVLFARGQDVVSPAAQQALRQFAQILRDVEGANFHVYIAGHTDDIPIRRTETLERHPNNWYLSAHRAVAVQEVLTNAGLSPERLGVMGFSEYHPVVPNAPGNRGAEENRRVELWIVPPDRFLTTGTPTRGTASAPAAAPAAADEVIPK